MTTPILAPTQAKPNRGDRAVAEARTEVERQRAILAEWEAKGAAATAELASLQEGAGVDLLDNPEAEPSIARSMAELRDRIDLAERAVIAQRPRILQAERRFLTVEADRREPEVRELEEELAQHEKKIAGLLRELEAHEGRFVPESDVQRLKRSLQGVVEFRGEDLTTWTIPKSARLREQITAARRPIAVLRAMAAGEDPARLIAGWGVSRAEAYPSCVYGPDAVVPAGDYLRLVDHHRARVAELEALTRELPLEIAEWEQRLASGAVEPRSPEEPRVTQDGIDLRCHRLERIEDDLIEARRVLDDLTTPR